MAELRIGGEILGYRLEELVGRGGMGVVYRAYDRRLKRNVALKLIAPELSEDASFRDRFLTETELAASLEHPNVVPIHDAGDVGGQLYIAMRYVEGGELNALLNSVGPLGPARALAICGRVAAALDAAHAHGLVHHDVKPSNVLLDADEHVYLADFGLSRRLADPGLPAGPGPSLGTPAYVAPEQIAGEEADGRADVYSLGCVLYECLTGDVPYRRDSELAMLWAHLQDGPPVAAGYPALGPVVATALAKDPDNRYGTCAELVEAARDALGLRDRVVVRDRKALLLTAIGTALVAAAIVAGVLLSQSGGGPSRPSTTPTVTPRIDSLQRINPETNRLAATLRLGSDPTGVAVGRDAVWTIHLDDNRISKIDPRSNEVAATGSVPGPKAVATGSGSVWVLAGDGRTVTQFEQRSGAQLHLISVPGDTELLTFGSGAAWAASPLTGVVSRINPRSSSVSGSGYISVRRGALKGIAAGEGAVWISHNDIVADLYGVFRIDPASGKVIKSITLRLGAWGVAAGEAAVWVADPLGNTVSQIDPVTNRVVRRIKVGRDPIAVAAGEGGVWVTNYRDGTVSRIDPRLGRVVRTIKVGPFPDRIAVGLGGVWVTVHPR